MLTFTFMALTAVYVGNVFVMALNFSSTKHGSDPAYITGPDENHCSHRHDYVK